MVRPYGNAHLFDLAIGNNNDKVSFHCNVCEDYSVYLITQSCGVQYSVNIITNAHWPLHIKLGLVPSAFWPLQSFILLHRNISFLSAIPLSFMLYSLLMTTKYEIQKIRLTVLKVHNNIATIEIRQDGSGVAWTLNLKFLIDKRNASNGSNAQEQRGSARRDCGSGT
jgi:hypothetical protein